MPQTDFAGRDLGRYRLLARLGSGAMGDVYEALDTTLDRRVAVKILPPEVASDPQRVRRFAQEARTASALNHPHLISIFDIGQQDDVQFIAMEKIDGRTLRDVLAAGRMPLARGLELMAQIADALAAAHAAGVVHRDLKPENIMVSESGYPKVLDFGLARSEALVSSDAPTETGVVLGTAGYMSQEQAEGLPADARSDIFSLGCILYEVVTGRRAFRGKSAIDTLHDIVHSEPAPMTGAPAELQRIVRKALAKNPNDRYQSARDLAIDLRELARQLDKPRRNTGAIVVAAIAVVAIAVTIALLVRRHSAAPVAPRVHRLTVTGDVISAVLSPDGKYLCFVTARAEGQTIWLRQLATGQDLALAPLPPASGVFGETFTPDGSAIDYVLKSRSDTAGSLYRVSVLGGRSERLLGGIESPVSFAPDARRFTYVRGEFPHAGETALMIANADGSGARALATRRYPEMFVPIFFNGPAWSPDGRLIAAVVKRNANPAEAKLIAFPVDGGADSPISDHRWMTIGQAAWLPDGSAIAAIASDDPMDVARQQVWLIPWPRGPARALTNDLLGHRNISISADGKTLVTVAADVTMQVWSVALDAASTPARTLSNGKTDGGGGIALTSDGRIAYAAYTGSGTMLRIASIDGSNAQPLTHEGVDARFPVGFSGGVAYLCSTNSESDLCTIGLDGQGRRVAIRNVDPAPIAISRDGSTVAYQVNRRLWIAKSDGSGAHALSSDLAIDESFSPSGDRIALISERNGRHVVSVLDAQRGTVLWSMPTVIHGNGSCVRWTPDGSALMLNDWSNDRANVWKVPFDGEPSKLTMLGDMTALWFDITPDAKTIVMGRAQLRRDAVFMTEFR